MIKVVSEINLKNFAAWSGGKENLELLKKNNLIDIVEDYISELYPDGIGETELNDILWFGLDSILENIGHNLDDLY